MAHEYSAEVVWSRDGADDGVRYSRAHLWRFDGIEVPASSSPISVKPPFSKVDAIDPEEAFVASLSSCHMLFVLFYAAKAGFLVESYVDRAVGILDRNDRGREAIVEVRLRPEIVFGGTLRPDAAAIQTLHDRAHHSCYIANSVTARVTITPTGPAVVRETRA
ncbi:MAG: OsmC family protein [Bauldia sp.]|jgi:organic hydroperoxide reductase OsmC/OhrA